MRVFWLIVAIVVLLAGGALALPYLRPARPPQPAPQPAPAPIASAAPAPHPAPAPAPAPEAVATPGDSPTELAALAEAQAKALRERLPGVPISVTPAGNAAAPRVAGEAVTLNLPEEIAGFAIAPDRVERNDAGLLVDGQFVVTGEGTLEKPYVVTWEMLTSIGDEFDPRAGKRRLPGRIAMLHNKHVRISGYVAFPMMVKQPRELLVMLNQWDGCCIGVPPTPYDAVEVQLTRAVDGNTLFATAGSVRGLFQIKPYVVGDWLVGLYVMEGGELDVTDYGGVGS